MRQTLVKIPQSLRPKVSRGKTATVGQQKKIKKYGSIEGYQKHLADERIKAEIKSLDLENVTSVDDYISRYNQASPGARQYLTSPTQLKASIELENKQVGLRNLEILNKQIQETRDSIENYKRQIQEAIANKDSYNRKRKQESLNKHKDRLMYLEQQSGKAVSGDYEVRELINYALETADRKADISALKKKPKTEQQLIQEMKQAGVDYLMKKPTAFDKEFKFTTDKTKAVTISISEPQAALIKSEGPTYGPIEISPTERAILSWTGEKTKTFEESSFFMGDTEIKATIQPQFGTIIETGFINVKPWERIDITAASIRADYSTGVGVKSRVTEFIPVAGVPLTQLDEPVYLTSSADKDKLQRLIESKVPGAARKVRIFLREQQVIFKKDLGRYNQLQIKSGSENGLSEKEYRESIKLRAKINQGQLGTLGDVVYAATEEATEAGKTIDILGREITPRTGRRAIIGGTAAYETLTDILIFQAGGAAVIGVIGGTTAGASFLGAIGKAAKPLRYAIAPAGLGIGGLGGYREYQKRGDFGDAIAAGLGSGAGFFAGIYSKQIVEGTGKIASKAVSKLSRFIDLQPNVPRKFGLGYVPQETIPTGYSEAQIKVADKYARKKGISVKEALKRLFGKGGTSVSVRRGVRVIEIRDFIETAEPKQLQNFVKDAIKNISRLKISKAAKIKQIKQFLKLFTDAKMVAMIETPDSITWEIFDGTGVKVASGTYGTQAGGRPLMVTSYKPVGPKGVFDAPPMGGEAAKRAEDLKTGLELGVKGDYITGAQASAISLADKLAVTNLINVETTRVGSSIFAGAASILRDKKKSKLAYAPALLYDSALDYDTTQDSISESGLDFDSISGQSTSQISRSEQLPGSVIPAPPTSTAPPVIVPSVLGPGRVPRKITGPGAPTPYDFTVVDIDFGGRKRIAAKKTDAYFGEVKVKGKYQKVTDGPHTKKGARSVIARIIDNTISAQGRVVKVKKQPKKGTKLNRGDDYYERNQNKFRGFKMFKGRQVAVKDMIIEKKNRRIDTPGEKRGLTVAQFRSQGKLGRPKKGKPFRL